MGVTNYDNLIQNQVETQIVHAHQTMQERKAAQRISGASLRYFLLERPGQFDWSGLPTAVGQVNTRRVVRFDIVVTVDNIEAPLVDVAFKVFRSSNGKDWTEIDQLAYWNNTNNGVGWVLMRKAGAIAAEPFKSAWMLSFDAPQGVHIAFKLQVPSTDTGTITVRKVL